MKKCIVVIWLYKYESQFWWTCRSVTCTVFVRLGEKDRTFKIKETFFYELICVATLRGYAHKCTIKELLATHGAIHCQWDGYTDQNICYIHSSPKEMQLFSGCISFGEQCRSVNFWPNIISIWQNWHDLVSGSQGVPGKMGRLKLCFFCGWVYMETYCYRQVLTNEKLGKLGNINGFSFSHQF